MSVITITSGNYAAEVEHSSQPVLIDFWASWCGPCRMLSPIVEELAGEPLRLSWVAIDVAPAGKDMDFDAAMELYQALYGRFAQEYGEQVSQNFGGIDAGLAGSLTEGADAGAFIGAIAGMSQHHRKPPFATCRVGRLQYLLQTVGVVGVIAAQFVAHLGRGLGELPGPF